jgi:ABC-type nitrate/sulfonate/bicarbonate transport system permease component
MTRPPPARLDLASIRWRLLGVSGALLILGGWEILSHTVVRQMPNPDVILPPIERVIFVGIPSFALFSREASDQLSGIQEWLLASRVLFDATISTVARVAIGTAIGLVMGVGVGMFLYRFPAMHRVADLPVNLLRSIPMLALTPLFLMWYGDAEVGALVFVAIGAFSLIAINTITAISNVPPIYSDFARTLGASRRQLLFLVIIPAILPALTGALRVALGNAWMITIGSELIAKQYGLGRLLALSQTFLDTSRMIVIAVLLAFYGWLTARSYLLLADRMTRWQPSKSQHA